MNNKIYIIIALVCIVASFFTGWYCHGIPVGAPSITINSTDDYEKYIANIDSVCPFNGTTKTTECLDKEIMKQKHAYESLSNEILKTAQEIKESNDKTPVEVTSVLSSLPKYNETREAYIENICSLRNASESGGTAIIEDSRKCALYYTSIDIEILKNIKEFLIGIQK